MLLLLLLLVRVVRWIQEIEGRRGTLPLPRPLPVCVTSVELLHDVWKMRRILLVGPKRTNIPRLIMIIVVMIFVHLRRLPKPRRILILWKRRDSFNYWLVGRKFTILPFNFGNDLEIDITFGQKKR